MKKIIFTIIIAIFLSACSNKNITHDPIKNELLAYTQKTEIINKNERILALGTYLNPVYPNLVSKNLEEHFIVAIYPKEIDINENSFTVNSSIQDVMIRELKEGDELLKKVAFSVPWGKYYEIISPRKNTDILRLNFEIYPSDRIELAFQKVSVSMYWHPKR